NVSVDRLSVELARIAGDFDRRTHRVEVESSVDSVDVDRRSGSLHPYPGTRRDPDLETRRLRIAIVRRFDEHLGARVSAAGVKLVAGREGATNENGVLA